MSKKGKNRCPGCSKRIGKGRSACKACIRAVAAGAQKYAGMQQAVTASFIAKSRRDSPDPHQAALDWAALHPGQQQVQHYDPHTRNARFYAANPQLQDPAKGRWS